MGSGGKAGDGKYTNFNMSLHMGICAAGEGLTLTRVYVGEKVAWSGEAQLSDSFQIDKLSLFGGKKKEGGLFGTMHWLDGNRLQKLPTEAARRQGSDNDTLPGYRGIASLFFTGVGRLGGFTWASNNPYLRGISARLRRPSLGLNPDLALIPIAPGSNRVGANGAHVIYEIMTNQDWGLGQDPSGIDRAAFEKAAKVLYDEGFALSFLWKESTECEAIIGEVLDHIHATMYPHPRTGLQTIRLLRGDYKLEDLPVINSSNAKLTNRQRKFWGETGNEVVVTWTSPSNEKEQTVTAQDLANIAAQGEVISTARNYYMVRHRDLALRLAERELVASSAPLVSLEAAFDRTKWDISPGDVLNLQWPEEGIESMAVRVVRVNYGTIEDSRITVSLMEDIFTFGETAYSSDGDDDLESPDDDPLPEPLTLAKGFTAPVRVVGEAMGLDDPADVEMPTAYVVVIGARETEADLVFELYDEVTLPTGRVVRGSVGSWLFSGSGTLISRMAAEGETSIESLADFQGRQPQEGDYLLVGNVADGEEKCEIVLVYASDDAGFVLKRGIADTVPRNWPAGTRVWDLQNVAPFVDPTVRATGENISYWLAPTTAGGVLDLEDAPEMVVPVSNRAQRPIRPANVAVNGQNFTRVETGTDTTVTVTWANRSRTLESGVPLLWEDGNVSGESGQTTRVALLDDAGNQVHLTTDISGTSHTVTLTDFGAVTRGYIEVRAHRGGLDSLQAFRVPITIGYESDNRNNLNLSGDLDGIALGLSGDLAPNTFGVSGDIEES